jgi:hypothetical protein
VDGQKEKGKGGLMDIMRFGGAALRVIGRLSVFQRIILVISLLNTGLVWYVQVSATKIRRASVELVQDLNRSTALIKKQDDALKKVTAGLQVCNQTVGALEAAKKAPPHVRRKTLETPPANTTARVEEDSLAGGRR